jgi:hypothetical protein
MCRLRQYKYVSIGAEQVFQDISAAAIRRTAVRTFSVLLPGIQDGRRTELAFRGLAVPASQRVSFASADRRICRSSDYCIRWDFCGAVAGGTTD